MTPTDLLYLVSVAILDTALVIAIFRDPYPVEK